MSQEQGEPVIHTEKYTTVLPDGRKVTKTRITKTFTHQVQVPAGTPLPPGAQLISSSTVEGPAPTNGNGQATYHYQETSSSSGYNGDGHSNNGSTGQHSAQYSAENDAENGAEEQQQYNQFNQINNTINSQHGGGVVKTEPTVVVESTIDDNGRKVTKTTTTTSSSSGKPNSFSKFFKRFSLNMGKSDAELKPLPTIPVNSKPVNNKPTVHHTATVQVTQAPVVPSPEPADSYEPPEEVKKIHIQTLEVKKADGTKLHLSDCTGDRRALLIGINYTGLANPLHGCVNDTADMKKFLLSVGFQEENIRVLSDDQVGTQWMPTRENIFHHLKWLIHDAKKNDSYFLHYSGHGGQVRDLDGDETDGQDNCIFPVDHAENGVIIDDELHRDVVKKLPPGVRLTVLFDCCHSGSALDLPYIYAATGYIRGSSALANLGHELVEGNFDAEALKELQEKWQKLQLEEKEFARQVSLKAADADVIMFSGCKDDQTSADVSITRGGNTSSNGAMTYAFTKCIRENPVQSYQEMLGNIRDLLKDKYKQKPQLSSSRPMNMQELFHM